MGRNHTLKNHEATTGLLAWSQECKPKKHDVSFSYLIRFCYICPQQLLQEESEKFCQSSCWSNTDIKAIILPPATFDLC
jgi:hypothetical protein